MSAPKDAAGSQNLLRKYTTQEIDYAKCQLSCQNGKCVRTFIDCNKYWKQCSRLNEELERLKRMTNTWDPAKFEQLKATNANMAEKIKILESNEPAKKKRKEEHSHQQQENKNSLPTGTGMVEEKIKDKVEGKEKLVEKSILGENRLAAISKLAAALIHKQIYEANMKSDGNGAFMTCKKPEEGGTK